MATDGVNDEDIQNAALDSGAQESGGVTAERDELLEKPIAEMTGREFVQLFPRIGSGLRGDVGLAGTHVNSGPPGFANSGGHANFDPRTVFGQETNIVTLPDGGRVTLPPGRVSMTIRGFRIER